MFLTPQMIAILECDGKSLAIAVLLVMFGGKKHPHCYVDKAVGFF